MLTKYTIKCEFFLLFLYIQPCTLQILKYIYILICIYLFNYFIRSICYIFYDNCQRLFTWIFLIVVNLFYFNFSFFFSFFAFINNFLENFYVQNTHFFKVLFKFAKNLKERRFLLMPIIHHTVEIEICGKLNLREPTFVWKFWKLCLDVQRINKYLCTLCDFQTGTSFYLLINLFIVGGGDERYCLSVRFCVNL